MPTFIAALLGGLVEIASSLVGRVLVALGVSIATYSGVGALFDAVKVQAFSALDAAAADSHIAPWLAVLHVGACFNILFSALAARLALSGLSSGTIKRWVFK